MSSTEKIHIPTMTDLTSVVHGDAREVLKRIPANTFDAVICDPPYV